MRATSSTIVPMPIGTYIEANGIYFQVVGVFGSKQTGQQADRILNTIGRREREVGELLEDPSLTIALTAVGVIAVFGALAGMLPAYYAAKIRPVEALRTE